MTSNKMENLNMAVVWVLFLSNFLQLTPYACLAKKSSNPSHPIVINTWNFQSAGEEAWRVLQEPGASALDAVQGIRLTTNIFRKTIAQSFFDASLI